MSGSSLDGLDIVFVELQEKSGSWQYTLHKAACYEYSREWVDKLKNATSLNTLDYLLLDTEYGHYIGEQVNRFIRENNLQFQVQLIASHGHTSFHSPSRRMTAQLGKGSAIAAATGINVVSDLRALDVALGGQGAPIVPMGEQLLLGDYLFFLNLGGIANISFNDPNRYVAYDVCPANRVLNGLASRAGQPYDDGGAMARKGQVSSSLLQTLNSLEYYRLPYPKSLSNDFGTDVVLPIIGTGDFNTETALRTYTEHISEQVAATAAKLKSEFSLKEVAGETEYKMLVTGGGARNTFLVERLREALAPLKIAVEVPDEELVDYKEAIIMALIGILRWREENNTIASVTGASRGSIGGAVWIGQEA